MSSTETPRRGSIATTPTELILRLPVLGWVYLTAALVSLASAALIGPAVLRAPSVAGTGVLLGCVAYAGLAVWCWVQHRRATRTVLPLAAFAWATITFIAAAAIPQRVGVNTVGFIVLPTFVFMVTLLGQRRLSAATVTYTALLLLGVTVDHLMGLPHAAARYAALANTVISAGLIAVFALLGHHIAQVMGRQVENARLTAQRYRSLFDRLPVAALVVQEDRIVDFNEAASLLFDQRHGHGLFGCSLMDLMPPQERDLTHSRMIQARGLTMGEGLPLRDLNMHTLEGVPVPVTVTAMSIDPAQRTLLSLIIDRTREDHARRELRRTQELLQGLFRATSHGMAVTDLHTGEFLLVNPAYAQSVGHKPEAMIGRTSLELGIVKPEYREQVIKILLAKGQARDIPIRLTDAAGVVRDLRYTFTATELEGRQVLVSVGHDVTDELRRERELRAILAATPAATVVIRHGRVTAASTQFERLMGLAQGTAVGRTCVSEIGGEQAMAQVVELVNARLRAGEVVSFEHPIIRPDGSEFPSLLTGRLIRPGVPDGFGMVWVCEDLTERHEREQRLARAKTDAEAASRAKTGFLAAMSHEIRTPLNGILGLIDLMQDRHLDEASRQHYLELMAESAQSLQAIVSDVIDVSRIESGRLELDRQVFHLASWLQSVCAAFSPLAEAKGLVLKSEVDEAASVWVVGDPMRLRQILSNYLSNALKFTLKGQITVCVRCVNAQRVRFEVHDTGIGISGDLLQQLFQPYSQLLQRHLDGRAAGEASGLRSSGLGLSICRQLAELMGGQTGVSSEYGLGSCFWAEVALPQVQAPAAKASRPAAESLAGMRVLVVDDNRINRVVARQLLERAGARVDLAESGPEALRFFDGADMLHDIVLMDIQMPDMDGFQTLALLRARPSGQSVPVLAVSAAVTTEEVDLTRAAGFDGFVSKPLESALLIKAVQAAVRDGAHRF